MNMMYKVHASRGGHCICKAAMSFSFRQKGGTL